MKTRPDVLALAACPLAALAAVSGPQVPRRIPTMRTSPLMLTLLLAALAALPAAGSPAEAPEFPDRLLVWMLPETVAADGPAELTVEILHEGRVSSRHTARVVLDPVAGRRAVEVLAGRPFERAAFAAMAERGGADVRVRFILDGDPIAERALADLELDPAALPADLRLLDQTHPAPQTDPPDGSGGGLFLVTAAGTDCSDRDACEDQCADQYALCLSYYCNGTAWCEPCERGYIDCTEDCPDCVCTDPKSVSTYTTRTYVGRTYLRSECYDGWTFDDLGTWWDEYRSTYRVDEYERTTMCDGSSSDRLVSTWYEYATCWQEVPWWQCDFLPIDGTPWPQC